MNPIQAAALFFFLLGFVCGVAAGNAFAVSHLSCAALIEHAARIALERGVPPDLLMGVCDVESAWRAQAIGDDGASIGLCQVKPETALPLYGPRWLQGSPRDQRLAIVRGDLLRPLNNLTIAAMHLRELLDRFDDDETLALIAYNGGARNASIIYVQKVRRARAKYAQTD